MQRRGHSGHNTARAERRRGDLGLRATSVLEPELLLRVLQRCEKVLRECAVIRCHQQTVWNSLGDQCRRVERERRVKARAIFLDRRVGREVARQCLARRERTRQLDLAAFDGVYARVRASGLYKGVRCRVALITSRAEEPEAIPCDWAAECP